MSAALCALLLLAPAVAGQAFDPEALGARPGGDAAANTKAIQSALDAAAAAGGGIVALKTPGVYDLATQGPNPYHPGHLYCLELRGDGLTLSVGPGVTLRLAERQQAEPTGAVDIVVWRARRGVRITGGGTLSGNTDGQLYWSSGYSQITNGNLIAGYGAKDAHSERVRIDDLTLVDHCSDAIYLSGHPDNHDRDIRIADVRAADTGEGILVMNADDVTLSGNRYQNDRVVGHPGDGIELWNVTGFRILKSAVHGRLGGSAIDLYGSRDGVVDGFTIDGGVEGVGIQENAALGAYAERIEVKNGSVALSDAGSGVFTKGARVRHVTVSAVTVEGGSHPGAIGFQISMDNIDSRASDDWRQQGPVTLKDCVAHGNEAGLLIKTVAGLTVSGGDYSGNNATGTSDGIVWLGQKNAYRRADTRDLVIRGVRAVGNTRYGIHIDGERLVGREPRGSITLCTTGATAGTRQAGGPRTAGGEVPAAGNATAAGGAPATLVHVASAGSPDIARDLTFDASCAPSGGAR